MLWTRNPLNILCGPNTSLILFVHQGWLILSLFVELLSDWNEPNRLEQSLLLNLETCFTNERERERKGKKCEMKPVFCSFFKQKELHRLPHCAEIFVLSTICVNVRSSSHWIKIRFRTTLHQYTLWNYLIPIRLFTFIWCGSNIGLT